MDSDLTLFLTVRFTMLDIVKYCHVDGLGLSFTVTDKICDCEGSSLHVSSFYRAVKVAHPPEKKAARQAYIVRHFILSWTLELWDLKALNAASEGKYKWKSSVCGHFVNISLGYAPLLPQTKRVSYYIWAY